MHYLSGEQDSDIHCFFLSPYFLTSLDITMLISIKSKTVIATHTEPIVMVKVLHV